MCFVSDVWVYFICILCRSRHSDFETPSFEPPHPNECSTKFVPNGLRLENLPLFICSSSYLQTLFSFRSTLFYWISMTTMNTMLLRLVSDVFFCCPCFPIRNAICWRFFHIYFVAKNVFVWAHSHRINNQWRWNCATPFELISMLCSRRKSTLNWCGNGQNACFCKLFCKQVRWVEFLIRWYRPALKLSIFRFEWNKTLLLRMMFRGGSMNRG